MASLIGERLKACLEYHTKGGDNSMAYSGLPYTFTIDALGKCRPGNVFSLPLILTRFRAPDLDLDVCRQLFAPVPVFLAF